MVVEDVDEVDGSPRLRFLRAIVPCTHSSCASSTLHLGRCLAFEIPYIIQFAIGSVEVHIPVPTLLGYLMESTAAVITLKYLSYQVIHTMLLCICMSLNLK